MVTMAEAEGSLSHVVRIVHEMNASAFVGLRNWVQTYYYCPRFHYCLLPLSLPPLTISHFLSLSPSVSFSLIALLSRKRRLMISKRNNKYKGSGSNYFYTFTVVMATKLLINTLQLNFARIHTSKHTLTSTHACIHARMHAC